MSRECGRANFPAALFRPLPPSRHWLCSEWESKIANALTAVAVERALLESSPVHTPCSLRKDKRVAAALLKAEARVERSTIAVCATSCMIRSKPGSEQLLRAPAIDQVSYLTLGIRRAGLKQFWFNLDRQPQ